MDLNVQANNSLDLKKKKKKNGQKFDFLELG